MKNKEHWENVYETKQPNEVSWTQERPETSLGFISGFNLSKEANIIDIGGGDSKLVDFLLKEGYKNITVLDISGKALERAKKRLGDIAKDVTWIESDIVDFNPVMAYDVWHDRAAFHFLTKEEDIHKYVNTVSNSVNGYLVMGTFSDNGPKKCSGLDITQYSEKELSKRFDEHFKKLTCKTEEHQTPFGTSQNFVFCSFKRSF